MKQILSICTLLAGLVACGPSEQKVSNPPMKDTINESKQEEIAPLTDKEMFYSAYNDLKKYSLNPYIIKEASDINNHIQILGMWALDLKEAKKINEASVKKDCKDFELLLIKVQKEAFPRFRKFYLLKLKQTLFRHNVEVRSNQPLYSSIELIGSIYANNANIEDYNEQVWDLFCKLRFKKIIYGWSEYDSKRITYTTKAPADSKIVY